MPTFRRGDETEIAKHLSNWLDLIKAHIVYDEGQLYQYRSGYWRPVSHDRLHRQVQKWAGSPIRNTNRLLLLGNNKIEGAIKCLYSLRQKPGFFAARVGGVVVFSDVAARPTKQGTIEIIPHSPKHKARHAYPFPYPSVSPNKGLHTTLLTDMFGGDKEGKEKVGCIQEVFGISLVGLATNYQRALILTGAGGDGKGVITRLIASAFPPGSVTPISPDRWGGFNPEYFVAPLIGKLLNLSNDPSWKDGADNSTFKRLVTGDQTDAREVKPKVVQFSPIAGHVITCNELPTSHDQSNGFWRRFLLVSCNRSFEKEGVAKVGIASSKEELEAARPALVVWLLEGAARLMKRGRFNPPASHKEATSDWERASDPLKVYLEENTRKPTDKERGIRAQTAYDHYRQWCMYNNHKAMSGTRFGLRMKELGLKRPREADGNRYNYMLGVQGDVDPNKQPN